MVIDVLFFIFLAAEFSPVLKNCSWRMQGDIQNIQHTDRLLENIGSRYVPFWSRKHICVGDIRCLLRRFVVQNFLDLGEHDETMTGFTMFPLLVWFFVIVLVVVSFVYQCLCQQLPEFNLTCWFLTTEVHGCQVHIHFGDTQEEGEDTFGPELCCPNHF